MDLYYRHWPISSIYIKTFNYFSWTATLSEPLIIIITIQVIIPRKALDKNPSLLVLLCRAAR